MDDTHTILATLVVLVAASVSILGYKYSNEIEQHLNNNEEAALAQVDEKPLPSKEEVRKVTPNKFVAKDNNNNSDAQTVDTADTAAESSGDELERRPTIKISNKKNKTPTKAAKRTVRATRVKESLRDPKKTKTQWFWRPNKKNKAAAAAASKGKPEDMGYEI